MYIKRNQTQQAYEYSLKKCGMLHVQFDANEIGNYVRTLSTISGRARYNEGDPISDIDLEVITEEVQKILGNIADRAIKKLDRNSRTFRQGISSTDYMLAAADFLYALTMRNLGSPDINLLFGTDIQSWIAWKSTEIQHEYAKYDVNTERTYNQQRGKNAAELRDSAVGIRLIEVKKAKSIVQLNPKKVAQLLADYQALRKRQEDHGSVWRFFHSSENKARNELLTEMETALKPYFDENQDLSKVNPLSIAEDLSDERVLRYLEEAGQARIDNIEAVYGFKTPKETVEKTNVNAEQTETEKEIEISEPRQKLGEEEKAVLRDDTNDKQENSIAAPVHKAPETAKVMENEINPL